MNLTIKECILGTLAFNGQRCTALKILFVHSQILKSFLDRFAQAVGELKFGMSWEDNVFITPLPEPAKPRYLSELVEDAQHFGAEIINQAGGTVNKTLFYPAVLYPVNSKMRVYSEEQFGPVTPIPSFDDIEIPIKYILDSNYGQQLSIFGTEADVIADFIDPSVNQVCRVNINSQCQRGPDTFPLPAEKIRPRGPFLFQMVSAYSQSEHLSRQRSQRAIRQY